MNNEEKGKTLGEYQKRIKDLEERVAIMDADNSALCTDLEHWKKVAAGSKGRNKQLVEENRVLKNKISLLEGDNSKEVEQLRDALSTANESIANYKSELYETKIKLADYKALIEWYNELSWWKRIFVKRIETH